MNCSNHPPSGDVLQAMRVECLWTMVIQSVPAQRPSLRLAAPDPDEPDLPSYLKKSKIQEPSTLGQSDPDQILRLALSSTIHSSPLTT